MSRPLLWILFLLYVLLSLPGVAQDSETVLLRENQRVDLLLDWRPGQQTPELPERLTFKPPVRPPAPLKPASGVSNVQERSVHLRGLEAWIRGYNRAVTSAQAKLFAQTIMTESGRRGMDPRLVLALVAAESAFQPQAISSAGAQGLGQLMPGTAAMLGVSDAFDPRQNLAGTVTYLERQLRRFGSPRLALAAYNAGPGAVQRYGGVPPYRETQAYVRYVLKLYEELKNNKSVTLAAEGVSP